MFADKIIEAGNIEKFGRDTRRKLANARKMVVLYEAIVSHAYVVLYVMFRSGD